MPGGDTGATLDVGKPVRRWDVAAALATSGLGDSIRVVGTAPIPVYGGVRTSLYAIPRSVVNQTPTLTSGTVQVPVAWATQLVDSAEADYYERVSIAPIAATARALGTALELAASGRSSMRRVRRLPTYQAMLSLNEAAWALALQRLHGAHRPLWLAFLQDAVPARPAEGAESIDDAAAEWRDWGRRNRLLA